MGKLDGSDLADLARQAFQKIITGGEETINDDEYYKTQALHDIIGTGTPQDVRQAIKNGAKLGARYICSNNIKRSQDTSFYDNSSLLLDALRRKDENRFTVAQVLLDKGLDIDMVGSGEFGTTALCSFATDAKAVKFLLNNNANPNKSDNEYYTPMDFTSDNNSEARDLIQKAGGKRRNKLASFYDSIFGYGG